MASKSICSRCLRLAAAPRPLSTSTATRAFSTTPLRQPSRQDRKIHSSSRRRLANPELQPRSNLDSGYIHPLSHEAGQQHSRQDQTSPLLRPNDLFHSFTNSPSPHIRRRAAVIRQNAYCPHPEHQPTRAATTPHDAETRKTGAMPPAHVRYECPDCGIPVSCSLEHFASDYESHLLLCDTLRQINEDDHDLVSGRMFPEFEMPGPQLEEAQVNMTNWDTLLYTREFEAVNDERSMRQVTRLLTYPTTIGSVLHELSPYSLRDQLTPEGLRSLTGRHTFCLDLHPESRD
jgi:splicing suppressor protein 51